MGVRGKSTQAAQLRASIGSVLYRPSAFDKWGKSKFTKMANLITDVIEDSLEELGQDCVNKARDNIQASVPGGNWYQIIDKKGNPLSEPWQASAPGEMPAEFTSLLIDSIDWKTGSGGDRADYVVIGVWSNEEWSGDGGPYRTINFYGKTKKHPYGRIVVDEEEGIRHPVKQYAKVLEEGEEPGEPGQRPFLRPAFEEVVLEQRKERQRRMKQIFTQLFGEKVPVTFRIYVGKQFQESSE